MADFDISASVSQIVLIFQWFWSKLLRLYFFRTPLWGFSLWTDPTRQRRHRRSWSPKAKPGGCPVHPPYMSGEKTNQTLTNTTFPSQSLTKMFQRPKQTFSNWCSTIADVFSLAPLCQEKCFLLNISSWCRCSVCIFFSHISFLVNSHTCKRGWLSDPCRVTRASLDQDVRKRYSNKMINHVQLRQKRNAKPTFQSQSHQNGRPAKKHDFQTDNSES